MTIAALAAGIWVWSRRASRPAWVIGSVVAVLWVVSAVVNVTFEVDRVVSGHREDAAVRARQTTLARDSVISGLRLPRGTVITHTIFGSIEALDLPSPATIDNVPLIGHVDLIGTMLQGQETLARDVVIGGIPCSASHPATFTEGKLASCVLAAPARVKGVPCAGEVDVDQGIVCTLASDYARFGYVWRAGTKLTDFQSPVWFRIGALAPSLRVVGAALGPDTEVEFEHGAVSGITLGSHPVPFRDCSIDLVIIDKASTVGRPVGACSLPSMHGSAYVALPSNALSPRQVNHAV